ncbi:response regulator [Sphingomonas sp. RB3P16]|uniref:response regulator transcription factor n=1 Tax=Parasphingomonas frigoris TaxID=3096163 RepID=UPI002FC9D771
MTKPIYIVDDDPATRRSLMALLARHTEFRATSFESGEDFLARTSEIEPGVVLLDIQMGGMSGLEVLATINKDALPFLCVILTGHGNIALAVEAMKSGAVDLLQKPYDQFTLIETIASAFDRLEQAGAEAARIAAAQDSIARLAPREVDVLRGLIAGKVNKVIAHELDISPRTVEVYRAHLMTKLRVRSLPDALRIAYAAGLVD